MEINPDNLAILCRLNSDKRKASNKSTKWEKNSRKALWPRQGRNTWKLPDIK